MKRLLTGFGALLALTMVASDAMSQQRRGNGGAGQGRSGSNGAGIQSNAGVQTQARIQTRAGMQGQGRGQEQSQRGNQSRQSSGLLSANTGELDLVRMWEEEKLARDVYASLAKTSKLPIFRTISGAESRHMQALERMIRAGGANTTMMNNTPGVFTFPEYQRLYDSLVASGSRGTLDALMVGAKIEEMDIADLRRLLAETTDRQAQQTLGQLLQGSQNHLRAFASQIDRQGAAYDAEFLTQAEFDEIANSSGRGQGMGHGQRGKGHGANDGGQGTQTRTQTRAYSGQLGSQGQAFGTQNRGRQGGGRQGGGRQGRN